MQPQFRITSARERLRTFERIARRDSRRRWNRKWYGNYPEIRRMDLSATVRPWHSIQTDVYHNNTKCKTGNNIESWNRRKGEGGRRLCEECSSLNETV